MSNTITATSAANAATRLGVPNDSPTAGGANGLSPELDHAVAKMVGYSSTGQPKSGSKATVTDHVQASHLGSVPTATATTPSPLALPPSPVAPPPLRMSEADIQSHLRGLYPRNSDDVQAKTTQIQNEINDPATPPELRRALVQFKIAITGESRPVMNDRQMEVISTLQRHRGDFPFFASDLQNRINDPKTPPDLKAALQQVKDDPTLLLMLDSTNQGGGFKNADGCLSDRDLDRLGEGSDMKDYNDRKAKEYVQNYIPSDADPSVVAARMMVENDALRELYLYSDNLSNHMDKESLQKIVDGTSHGAKMPPQVIAAAQFMLDHPQSWSKIAPGGSTSRSSMLDSIAKNVFLTADENKTLKTIDQNRDTFFKGGSMSRDSLQKLVDDPATTPDAKKAAKKMLADPLVFGMLDNAYTGHGSSLTKSADDGIIMCHDLDAFKNNSKALGKKQPDLPPLHTANTPATKKAVADMKAGEVDDPNQKTKKGGSFTDFMKKASGIFLKVWAGIEHFASLALSALSKIPIIGEIAAPLAMATEAIAGGLDIANAAIQGKDVKKAAEMAAMGIAGAAISIAVAPGAGAAVMKGVEMVAMKVGTQAAVAGTEKGVVVGTEKAAVMATEKTVATSTAKGAENGAESAASQGTKAVGKSETSAEAKARAKKEAEDKLKNDAEDTAANQASANNNQQNNGYVDTASMQGMNVSRSLEARVAEQERQDRIQENKARAQENHAASASRTTKGGVVSKSEGGILSTTPTATVVIPAAPATAEPTVAIGLA